ncbi:MAG: carbamoyltransferase HypF [Bacteroidetes bacterium]|nr:carbamoyltransferase HypF [Bacteroidota bacterium]
MNTYHIHINGIVQGVGFRPMVYQLAKEMQLHGHVKNGSDGLHVFFNADEHIATIFLDRIKKEAPEQSVINYLAIQMVDDVDFDDFSIVVEEDLHKKNTLISPDKAICDSCRQELYDKNNRRYRYPFITCTQCGPRYSIIQELPYERHLSSMEKFVMCNSCQKEYGSINDRRFFSQTNSCSDCGIEMRIHEKDSTGLSDNTEEILLSLRTFLHQGKIVAVKGVGGYLFLCDASNKEAIQLLRNRKQRPTKPFAVLYPGIEKLKNDFLVNKNEEKLLLSAEAPIVLLSPKTAVSNTRVINSIAPGLNRVGIMLPYSPLLDLIATDFGKPLIATSANISGSPIVYKDIDALDNLFEVADFVLVYNREIVLPQDDSVVQVSKYSGQQIKLRRSRGYAPSYLQYKPKKESAIISMGAFMKSSFALSVNGNVFVSQFLGSGETYESLQMYKDTLSHWMKLYQVKPDLILADMHPGYFSHQYAIELAAEYQADTKLVQHHEAHFAAILAENDLINTSEPVMGVVWDGTGLGTDGQIWGGEFFKYENNEMLRCYHFDYFPTIAGDKLALEPRIAALCASSDTWPMPGSLKKKFTEAEWNNYQTLMEQSKISSSSVGRLFDATASLLDICDKQTYEGEAAMYLQALAEKYVERNGMVMDESYFKEGAHYYRIPTASLMQGIMTDIQKNKPKDYIAAKFHYSLVCLVGMIAQNIQVEKICFSGGVFQNALLVDWIQQQYNGKYQLYFHLHLSPNDENISFGQLVYYDNDMHSVNPHTIKQTVLSDEPIAVFNS